MSKKISRKDLKAAADEMGLKTTVKGKPISNEALLALVEENMEDHEDDGKYEIEVLADIAAARDAEKDIEVSGDDPTVPKKSSKPEKPAAKAEKPAKGKKPAKEEDEDDEEEEEEDEKPTKSKKSGKKAKPADDEDDEDEAPKKSSKKSGKKDKNPAKKAEKAEKANTDRWGSREGSSAYLINSVLFKAGKNGLTAAQIHEAVVEVDDSITKDRVNAHLRRLHLVSSLIDRDAKDRYKVVKVAKSED